MTRRLTVKSLVAHDPKKAFGALAARLSALERRKNPAFANRILGALARHGDTLPLAWRTLLLQLVDEPAFALNAAVALAQVKPHRSIVPPMIRRVAARLEETSGRSSDDELGLAVLARCADARATDVLIRLLEAPNVAHWDLMLMACARCGSPRLRRPLTRWLQLARARGVGRSWEGFEDGKATLQALKQRQRKRRLRRISRAR